MRCCSGVFSSVSCLLRPYVVGYAFSLRAGSLLQESRVVAPTRTAGCTRVRWYGRLVPLAGLHAHSLAEALVAFGRVRPSLKVCLQTLQLEIVRQSYRTPSCHARHTLHTPTRTSFTHSTSRACIPAAAEDVVVTPGAVGAGGCGSGCAKDADVRSGTTARGPVVASGVRSTQLDCVVVSFCHILERSRIFRNIRPIAHLASFPDSTLSTAETPLLVLSTSP